MNPSESLGLQLMCEAIEHGGNLGELLTRLSGARQTPAGADIFSGAVSGLVAAFNTLRGRYEARCADDVTQAFLSASPLRMAADLTVALNAKDTTAAGARLSIIAGVVHALRQQVDLVAVGAIGRPAPLDVRVVGIPERIISTVIERDAGNVITGSKQTHADALPC